MIPIIEQFNKQAITKKLSGSAILLWQHLYFAMERRGRFANVPQQPGPLLEALQISRQGLHQIRQILIDKGFLTIRADEYQQTFYTLMIDGEIVGEKADSSNQMAKGVGASAPFCADADRWCDFSAPMPPVISIKTTENRDGLHGAQWSAPPTTITINASQSSTDLILTNRYRQYIDAFCEKFGPAPKADLLQWADMRRKNGWTLTLWGLEAVLRNLVELSGGDAVQMGKIAAQSVKRRWKGFFALTTKAQPSGEKLLKQEQKQQRQNGYGSRLKNAVTQKFAPEGRDLSFLVV